MGRILLVLVAVMLAFPAAAAAQPCPVVLPICQEPEPEPTPEPTPPPDAPPQKPQPPPPPPISSVEGSATAGVDPAHSGYFADTELLPPLERRWSRKISGEASAPLYGGGRVYITWAGKLRALDAGGGRDAWAVADPGVLRAYDAGRVFTAHGGTIRAYAAADGAALWTAQLSDVTADLFTSFPIATSGLVYVGIPGAGETVALDAATGREVWRAPGGGGDAPFALDEQAIYASGGCEAAAAWSRVDGALLWGHRATCSGGTGSMPVVHRGRVYVPESMKILDTAGALQGKMRVGGTPMFAGDVGVFDTADRALEGIDLDTGRRLWKTRVVPKDQFALTAARIISGPTVYALAPGGPQGPTGYVHALDLRSGARLWTGEVPGYLNGDQATAIGAGPGRLFVVGGGALIAFKTLFDPPPGGIEIGPRQGYAVSGGRAYVGGVVGTNLRRLRRATLEYDEAPYGRWRRAARGAIAADGWVGWRVRPGRNTRFRVRAGRRRSNVATYFAYPRIGIRLRVSGNRLVTTATFRHARTVRLGGRRAVLYLGRTWRKRYDRMAAAVVQPAGPGRSRVVFVHGAPSRVEEEDFVTVCMPGQARAGLGQNVGLTRRCGRRSVRF